MADDLIERVARAVSQAMLGHDIVPDNLNQPYTEGSKLGTVMRIAMAATEVQSREIAALREALAELFEISGWDKHDTAICRKVRQALGDAR